MNACRLLLQFIRLAVFGILLITLPACTGPTPTDQPEWPLKTSSQTRAIFAEGRLWILESGAVSSIAEGENGRLIHVLPERALDLCVDQQHVVVVTASNTGSAWTVMRHSDAGWSTTGTVETKDDNFVAASCAAGSITILTTTRLVSFDGKDQHTIPLAGTLTGGQIGAIYSSPDEFVVGFNNGEFGGGLRRIDRRSGKITSIEDVAGDSINSIITDPWKPGCVVAASGVMHMGGYGRIVEVCGTRVEHLYSRPTGIVYTIGADSFPSDPFYWLSSDGKNLWAVGADGYYSIDSQGNAQVLKHPPLKDVKGIAVSFDLPHFVVVQMNVSQPNDTGVTILQIVPR